MKRLDSKSLPAFLSSPGVAVVMFGAAVGEATLEQAEQFALLWADHAVSDVPSVRPEVRFGYVDGTANWQALEQFDIDKLPATLAVRNGVVTHRLEGLHLRDEIAQTLH
jgi:hypothetical protein